LAAVTNSDMLNAVVAHTARTIYNVPVVVVRNYDPRLLAVIEAFGLQTVSSTSWGAQRVEELLTKPVQKTVYSTGHGEVEVYELGVPAHWNGRTVGELLQPFSGQCFPVSVTRAGRSFLPEAAFKMETDDLINISSTPEAIGNLTSRLNKKAEA
jgi:trk system potassium uptake protein TrkA